MPKPRQMQITTVTSYIFTQAQLKDLLSLEGDFEGINLWQGLSSHEEDQGMSHDKDEYEFKLRTKKVISPKS